MVGPASTEGSFEHDSNHCASRLFLVNNEPEVADGYSARRGNVVTKTRGPAVLCIGNDPVHLNLRCAALKEYGWRVISSGSGHEGVIRFGQEAVDAVVIDLNHDGSESALITGELKRIRPELPVVIIVSDAKNLADEATNQASAVIEKSQGANKLIHTIEALLRRQP